MSLHLQGKGIKKQPPAVSVISWIMPTTYKTRLSLRRESGIPSLRWNHTRWQGQDLITELSHYVVSRLQEHGYHAVAPELSDFFKTRELLPELTSNWSHRHMAYAVGLGTFGLSDGFITPKGIAMRCASVVSDIALPPTPRIYRDHLANCLFYRNGSCGRCIKRCPGGAISERGHDKQRCRQFMATEQKEMLAESGREGYIGRYHGCGLCQSKVPCEARIPPDIVAGSR